jgi:hypothetical protein
MKYGNDKNTADRERRIPRLREIDDSKSGRFPTRSVARWEPGVVEVEFHESLHSGFTDDELLHQRERIDLPNRWPEELIHRLQRNRIVAWQPSFPVVYPWSRESGEEALRSFKALGRDKFVTLRFPDDADVSAIAKELALVPGIVDASPVARLAPPSPTIDDPLCGTSDQITRSPEGLENQWYAVRCNLPQALERATGKNVIVADIDWGFNEFHLDYGPFIEKKKNTFLFNGGISEGSSSDHGTAVLGLAGARLDGLGMVGFAPESTLWAIQAGRDQIVKHNNWIAGLDFVRTEPDTRPKVAILEIQTLSGGNVEMVRTIRKAIIDAIAAGIVVCVPAGNSPGDAGLNDNNIEIEFTGSVLVGATSFGETRNVVCSKEGSRIVVYAPGDKDHDLTCSIPEDCYRNKFGGTSGAVAKVAGAVALMLELDPSLSPVRVREILSLSQIPVHNTSGARMPVGLLDCADALNRVSPV